MKKNNLSYNSLNGEDIKPDKLIIPDKTKKSDARCNIYRKENMAITMSYLSVGLVMSLIQTPLNIYMVHILNAEPPLQNTLAILQTLPWSPV